MPVTEVLHDKGPCEDLDKVLTAQFPALNFFLLSCWEPTLERDLDFLEGDGGGEGPVVVVEVASRAAKSSIFITPSCRS